MPISRNILIAIVGLGQMMMPSIRGQNIPSPEVAPLGPPMAHPKPTEFAVASIKPIATGDKVHLGFRSLPGGRVEFGGTIEMLIAYAYEVETFELSGGPDWMGKDSYDVTAIPPDSSVSRTSKLSYQSTVPTEEQRQMLQRLLADRFSLHVHEEQSDKPVYLITRGTTPLALVPPKDSNVTPSFALNWRGDIANGEIWGRNVSIPQIARDLGMYLRVPVLDRSGIEGSFDLHCDPFDAENTDLLVAAAGGLHRIGLELKRSVGPVRTILVDSISRPTPN